MNYVTRVPVVWHDKPLMPMKWKKAKRLVSEGKAVFKYDSKLGIKFLKMLVKPQLREGQTEYNTQNIVLGIDPGSAFDGFTIISNSTHHENIELIHPEKYKDTYKGASSGYKKGSISYNLKCKSQEKRLRNSRKRHRPARFDSRTKQSLVPTILAMNNFRTWLINILCALYPINKICFEKIAKSFKKGEKATHFSIAQHGQKRFISFLRERFGYENVKTRRGFVSFHLRKKLFGYLGYDPKTKFKKDDKNYYAHCGDSTVLASLWLCKENAVALTTPSFINTKVRFIDKQRYGINGKRHLTQLKAKYGNEKYYVKPVKKEYVGKKDDIFFEKDKHRFLVMHTLGKPNVCMVQKEKKNFKDFNILINKREERSHMFIKDDLGDVPLINPRHSGGHVVKPKPISTGINKHARYRDIKTGEIFRCNTTIKCREVYKNANKYVFVDYMNRNLQVIKSGILGVTL